MPVAFCADYPGKLSAAAPGTPAVSKVQAGEAATQPLCGALGAIA